MPSAQTSTLNPAGTLSLSTGRSFAARPVMWGAKGCSGEVACSELRPCCQEGGGAAGAWARAAVPKIARKAAAITLLRFMSPPFSLLWLCYGIGREATLGRELVYPDMLALSKRDCTRLAVPVDPIGPWTENQQRDDSKDGNRVFARWRRRPRPRDVEREQQGYERPPGDVPDAVPAPGRAHIQGDPGKEEDRFDRERRRYRPPQPQAQLLAASGVQRHVGDMAHEIQHPVARDDQPQPRCARPVAARRKRDERKCERLREGHQQAVRPRVVREIEGIDRGESRDDAKALDAEQHEHRPDDVEEGGGEDQRTERHPGRSFLRSERDREVADEHPTLPDPAGPSSGSPAPVRRPARS